ncbi:hypothetical protein BG015_003646, partial [Linnemannia schmuckeri]
LASSLGLSEDGVREDIVERIKAHIATSNDPTLRALIREDSPDGTTTTTTTTTYITKDNSTSASGRSSPRKKTTSTVVTKESRSSSGGARRGSHSLSPTEDEELEERQVRGFMEHMQGELHEAKDLAKQLEETLHAKFTTGNSSQGKRTVPTTTATTSGGSGRKGSNSYNSTSLNSGGRRGSKDHSSFSRHDSGHSSSHQHHEDEHSSSHLLRSRRLHHDDDEDDEEEGSHHRHRKHHRHHHRHDHGHSWGTQAICAFKNYVVDNFCQHTPKPWKWLQDLGSTSRGFVWLTLMLELAVFISQAYVHLKNTSEGSCLSFLTNWPNFLQPFFSYYGTFFLLPTLLSQLFNVDTSRSSSSNKQSLTGLLSKHTTSGLSYFVFKFALTYFLGHSVGFKSLLGTPLPVGAKMWSGCKYISDIFRYVPHTLGLATSGAGTVLALAESIVQSNHHRR